MKAWMFSVLGLFLTVESACANLIVNGSFESYSVPPSSWTIPDIVNLNLPPGDLSISGWSVINSEIDYVASGTWLASDGDRSLDLNGSPGAGGVEQSFATVIGASYLLSFDMAGNPDPRFGDSPLKLLQVSVAGQLFDFSYDTSTSGQTETNFKWQNHQLTFVATSSQTTLDIYSTMPVGYAGPTLDNVSVTDVSSVPEPGSLTLAGLGIVGLVAGAYRRRKLAA